MSHDFAAMTTAVCESGALVQNYGTKDPSTAAGIDEEQRSSRPRVLASSVSP
jgi:hypothetical protein